MYLATRHPHPATRNPESISQFTFDYFPIDFLYYEYLKVLSYPKFRLSEKEINYILYSEILPYFEVVIPQSGQVILQEDPSDDKFLHCAKAGKAGVIISGDQHLLNLKLYGKIQILTPLQFLEKF